MLIWEDFSILSRAALVAGAPAIFTLVPHVLCVYYYELFYDASV